MSRWMHRLYAGWFGYFWLPCPNCGRMYGGHERSGGSIYRGAGVSQSTCAKCKIGYQPMNDFDGTPFSEAQVNDVYRRFV